LVKKKGTRGNMPKHSRNVKINLSAIIYHEDAFWIAHCLEMDIVAEGTSPSESISNLQDLCVFQIDTALEEGDLQSIFRPAPPEIWKMFTVGSDRTLTRKLPKQVHRFEARELEFA